MSPQQRALLGAGAGVAFLLALGLGLTLRGDDADRVVLVSEPALEVEEQVREEAAPARAEPKLALPREPKTRAPQPLEVQQPAEPRTDPASGELLAKVRRVRDDARTTTSPADMSRLQAELDAALRNEACTTEVAHAIDEARDAWGQTHARLRDSFEAGAREAMREEQFAAALEQISLLAQLIGETSVPLELKIMRDRATEGTAAREQALAEEQARVAAAQAAETRREAEAKVETADAREADVAAVEAEVRKRAEKWFEARRSNSLSCQTCKGQQQQACTQCKGRGYVKCANCGGKGRIQEHNGQALGRGRGQTRWLDCPECPHYYGQQWAGHKICPKCNQRDLYPGGTATHDCEACVTCDDPSPGYRALSVKRAFWDYVSKDCQSEFKRRRFPEAVIRGEVLRNQLGPSLGIERARITDVRVNADHVLVTATVVWSAITRDWQRERDARYEEEKHLSSGTYTTRWIRQGNKFFLQTRFDKDLEVLVPE